MQPASLAPRRRTLGNSSALGLAFAVVFATAVACAVFAQAPSVAPADSARYLDTIKALTTPAMEGRGDDTAGINKAAELLERRYKSFGLEPAGTNGFLQPFSVITGAKLAGNNQVSEEIGANRKDLKLNEDFVPFSFSATGQAAAPLVFAGYGATADEFGYDDYRGHRREGQDCCAAALRTLRVRGEERQPRLDAPRRAGHQSDQRAQSRRESGGDRKRQAGHRRRRPAHALRQRERSGERRHPPDASEEQHRAGVVRRGGQVAHGRAEPDQLVEQARFVRVSEHAAPANRRERRDTRAPR